MSSSRAEESGRYLANDIFSWNFLEKTWILVITVCNVQFIRRKLWFKKQTNCVTNVDKDRERHYFKTTMKTYKSFGEVFLLWIYTRRCSVIRSAMFYRRRSKFQTTFKPSLIAGNIHNSKSLFAILHEYTYNTERANNTDVYDASFTSNKVQRNHQIKWQKGARNLRRFMGPLTVEQVHFEKKNKTSAGGASAASSRYSAVLKLWMKIHNFMMDLNL